MAASEGDYVAIRPDVIRQQLERINVYLNEAGEDRYVLERINVYIKEAAEGR